MCSCSVLQATRKLKTCLVLSFVQLFLRRAMFVHALEVSGLIDLNAPPTTNEGNNATAAALVSNNGRRPFRLIIYDPRTGQEATVFEYMRPTFGNTVDLTRLWQPCWCTFFTCQCCLGLKMGEWLNNNFCFDTNYSPAAMAINLGISFNERYNLSSSIPVNAPPTACIPLITPLPIYICLRVDSVRTVSGNATLCTTLLFRLMQNDLMQFLFGCVRFGRDGFFFNRFIAFSPEGNGNRLSDVEMAANGIKYNALT
ncbi:uncharacterized protein LOC115066539 [Bactrocera dorsalis]|uniref:Uncharacterized protein LOC115066539 n=1 Tax=Bactrocera dorsalis TaxID=27457 RepID=A0A8N4L9R4_BACDO|nr:uncharacterized protein LOC115066539 [Bactrocera dorsalis]